MKWKDIYQYVLGAIVILAFFGVLAFMILQAEVLKGNDNQVLNAMVGILGSISVMVASYFFGSSKGSSDKNAMIEKNGNAEPKPE